MKPLITILVLAIAQTALARFPRRMGRPNQMSPLREMMGPERIMPPMRPARMPVIEKVLPLPPTPNTRIVQPKTPCQIEQPCPRITEVAKIQNVQFIPNMPAAPVPVGPNWPIPPPMSITPVPVPPAIPVAAPLPASPYPVPPAMPLSPVPAMPEILPLPMSISAPIIEKAGFPCTGPTSLVSPFLPAASPVSAWAPPTSNRLPPVTPGQSRNNYLRKIPIPPPTL